jgi:hypothetical protein
MSGVTRAGQSGRCAAAAVVSAERSVSLPARPVDQRHHPLAEPGLAGALALTDVQLPEQVPLDLGESSGWPRSRAARPRPSAEPPQGGMPQRRTSGRSPDPPATRRIRVRLHR